MVLATRKTLLEHVRDGDAVSWEEFYKTYAPLIKLCAKDQRVPDAALDDIVQDVMSEFFNARKKFKYDPAKGRFSHYLREMTRHHVFKHLNFNKNVTIQDRMESRFLRHWDEEFRSTLIKEVVRVLKTKFDARAYQAFHLSIFGGVKPLDVAERLEISVSAVYTIRSRGIVYLKETLKLAGYELNDGK